MTEIELDRIVTLKQAAELMGVSVWTVRTAHRDKLIRLSSRRLGMRARDALLLGSIREAPSTRVIAIQSNTRPKV
jgi:hypothetical protein